MNDPHSRTPVADTFRKKSPIEGLLQHMNKVRECIEILKDGLKDYYEGEFERFSGIAERVAQLEHEADLIKGNIRAHLPRFVLMPVDKGQFQWLLREEDAILDHAENLAEMLEMRHTKIPKKLKNLFIEHLEKVVETIRVMEEVIDRFKILLETSFVTKERDMVKEKIHEVHRKEWEADQIKFKLTKEIYKMEKRLKPMDEYHLLKIADWVDDMADHAENVADLVRAMIAR